MNKYIIQGRQKWTKIFFVIKDFAYLHQRNNVDIVTIQYIRNKELVTLSLEGKKVKT